MVPDPLHPAVVHFPIVLAALLPIFAVAALWAIRSGTNPRRAWLVPLLLTAALAGSAWGALASGEAEEDRVAGFVEGALIHAHEEAAERFVVLSGLVLLVAALGVGSGTVGGAARLLASAGSLLLLAAALSVGQLGGELVYRHGAAEAYRDRAVSIDPDRTETTQTRRSASSEEESDAR